MDTLSINLRAPRVEDVPLYATQLADPEVSRWLDDACQRPLTLQQVEAFVFQNIWCRWAIDFEGTFVGLTGLEPTGSRGDTARLFIVIGRRELWKRGVGTEVVGKVLHQAFRVLGLRRVLSDYLEPNRGSAVIHRRNGFVEEGQLRDDAWRDGRWVDRTLLSILRDEYLNAAARETQAAANRNAAFSTPESVARKS
jgi:RimJ/RimL family protein N-acetyltransferase